MFVCVGRERERELLYFIGVNIAWTTVKVVIFAGVKYAFSMVKPYAWVLNTQMRDLPL